MIDERKLIEFLEEIQKEHPYKIPGQADTCCQYNESWQDCIDRIESFIDSQPKIGGWILCSDRLPENVGNYIIHVKTGTDEDYVGIWGYQRGVHLSGKQTYIDDKQGYWASLYNGDPINEPLSKRVIAWQPLPEAYHE